MNVFEKYEDAKRKSDEAFDTWNEAVRHLDDAHADLMSHLVEHVGKACVHNGKVYIVVSNETFKSYDCVPPLSSGHSVNPNFPIVIADYKSLAS